MELDKKQILEYQQNRDPYLMIDHVQKVEPGISSEGYKNLSKDEWFFKVHWPEDPNMPAMLQTEAMVQMTAMALLTLPKNKGKLVYLLSAKKLQFKKKVVPNCKFYIKSRIITFKRGIADCSAKGVVNDNTVCSADFTVALPHVINYYKVNT